MNDVKRKLLSTTAIGNFIPPETWYDPDVLEAGVTATFIKLDERGEIVIAGGMMSMSLKSLLRR